MDFGDVTDDGEVQLLPPFRQDQQGAGVTTPTQIDADRRGAPGAQRGGCLARGPVQLLIWVLKLGIRMLIQTVEIFPGPWRTCWWIRWPACNGISRYFAEAQAGDIYVDKGTEV